MEIPMISIIKNLRNQNKETSIEKAFLILSLLVTTGLIIFFALGSSLTFQYIVQTVFKERLQVSQNLFVQSLSQDLITGSNNEAYRKCKAFFNETDVVSIKVQTSNGIEICSMSKPADQTLAMVSHIYFDEEKSKIEGNVDVSFSLDKLYAVYWRIIVATIFLIFALFAIQIILLRKIGKKVTQPIKNLSDKLKNGQLEDFLEFKNKTNIVELNILNEGLRELSKNSLEHQKSKILQAEGEAAIQIAKQVSHDIRSPLSALTMLISSIQDLPEDKRILVRNAVNRISDIANSLLNHGKKSVLNSSAKLEQHEITLMASLVDSLVSEKRIQFRDKLNIQVEAQLNESYGLFAKVNPTELKRTISNAINNAAEAFGNSPPVSGGLIDVILNSTDSEVILTIKDNGKGIPKHILNILGQKGVTHGKEGTESGSGLGVYHAKKTIESFGGKFEIKSAEGQGTSVIMTLKRESAPTWFVQKLNIKRNQFIVATDDDASILEIWKQRFAKLIKDGYSELLTFSSGASLKDWFNNNPVASANAIYLMDFELLGQQQTGLDLIEELKIANRSILVTSRYEEVPIKERCLKSGVKMIPKGMASLVPIDCEVEKQKLDCILIDDDVDLVHAVWKFSANQKMKSILCFTDEPSFVSQASSFSFETPIYVDVNLANGVNGKDVAKRIHHMGFKKINLATGYEASSFQKPDYIDSISGKDFPL